MDHLLFTLLALIWGSSFILMKHALASMTYLDVSAYRLLTGAAALWVVWALTRRRWPLGWRSLPSVLLLAVVGYAIPFNLQPYVIQRITEHAGAGSSFAAAMVSPVPLLTVLVSVPMLGVYPRPRQLLGVLGGLALMGVLIGQELRHDVPLTDLLLATGTPLCYALANTFVRMRLGRYPPMAVACLGLTLAGVLSLPIALAGGGVEVNAALPWSLTSLVLLGVVATGLAMAIAYHLIQQRGPLYMGMVTYLIPSLGVAWGWLDGEPITLTHALALAGILAMVALVNAGPRRAQAPADG